MVLPGWNVSEPIHIAKKLYDYIQEVRGASDEARSFASKLKTYCVALEELEKCLTSPTAASTDDTNHLRTTLDGCQNCAIQCQRFIEQFKKLHEPIPGKYNAVDKVNWVFKKDTAIKLRHDIDSQISDINLLLGIASLKDRTRQQSPSPNLQALKATSRQTTLVDEDLLGLSEQDLSLQKPLTPADLLNIRKVALLDHPPAFEVGEGKWIPKSPGTFSSPLGKLPSSPGKHSSSPPTMKHVPTPTLSSSPTDTSSSPPTIRRQSFQDFPTQDVLLRRDSRLSLYSPVPETTMDGLHGVTIHYKKTKANPLPIEKIEFMTDSDGNHRYIIASPPSRYYARFHQRISRSSRSIPHTEHPRAYGNQKRFLVKFLEPHQFTSQRWGSSSGTPSIRSMRSQDTPSTTGSIGSVGTSVSIGSPILPTTGGQFKEETEYPMYEFEREEDYWTFQENIIGKSLLLNAPVDHIAYRKVGESKASKQSERQYLRLWNDQHGQTIMFHANNSGQYMEFDLELFRPIEGESSPHELLLALKANGMPSPEMAKRRWSIKSSRSNSMAIPQGSRSPISSGNTIKELLPKDLVGIEFLIIDFTDSKEKTTFLEKANFNGKGQSPLIPPLEFEPPRP